MTSIGSQYSMRFLGTGNAWSKPPINYNNNVLIEAEGKKLLIDCGILAPLALHSMGLGVDCIDAIFITHTHGDHVFGLEEVALYNFFIRRRRVGLWTEKRLFTRYSGLEGEDLWENCLRGALETEALIKGERIKLGMDDYFDLTTVSEGIPFTIFGVKFECFEVIHSPKKPCFGLIINDDVAFTSDTTFSRQRIDSLLGRGVHTIFHDCSFVPSFEGSVHTSIDELATLPLDITRKIILMHYDDTITDGRRSLIEKCEFRLANKDTVYRF